MFKFDGWSSFRTVSLCCRFACHGAAAAGLHARPLCRKFITSFFLLRSWLLSKLSPVLLPLFPLPFPPAAALLLSLFPPPFPPAAALLLSLSLLPFPPAAALLLPLFPLLFPPALIVSAAVPSCSHCFRCCSLLLPLFPLLFPPACRSSSRRAWPTSGAIPRRCPSPPRCARGWIQHSLLFRGRSHLLGKRSRLVVVRTNGFGKPEAGPQAAAVC